MQKIVKIKDAPGIVKDITTGALLNTNTEALLAYRARREHAEKVNTLQSDVQNLKSELKEIKELLLALVSSEKK